jgi:hypothetical protein
MQRERWCGRRAVVEKAQRLAKKAGPNRRHKRPMAWSRDARPTLNTGRLSGAHYHRVGATGLAQHGDEEPRRAATRHGTSRH